MTERRALPRAALPASALVYDDRRAVYARIHDASERGLSVRVPTPFRPGDIVAVSINSRIKLRARVSWAAGDECIGIGVEVTEILEGADEFRALLASAA